MKLRVLSLITQCALGLLIVYAIVGGVYFAAYQKADEARTSAIESLLSQQHTDINQAQLQLAALLAANQSVAEQLKSESAMRLAAEQESKAAQNKLNLLAQTVENNKAPNVSETIKEWRPRVVAVHCAWPAKNNIRTTKLGTAVLMPSQTSIYPQLLTSGHVLKNNGDLPESCTLTFPGQEEKITITTSDITLSDTKYDWAKITLTNPPAFVTSLAFTPAARCATPPATGNSVIILGYPKIGTKDDITATEGIIAGAEDNYYITSAKVERGNSGGAAILLKQNCYLGIPTFVDAGEIESLARILDQKSIPK